jgi:hypothetical protein
MVEASALVVDAVSIGDITPDEAAAVQRLIEGHGKLLEIHELESRIAALEQKVGSNGDAEATHRKDESTLHGAEERH